MIDKITNTFSGFFDHLLDSTNAVLPGILLLLASFAIAFIIGFIFRILFRMIGLNKLAANNAIGKAMEKIGIKPDVHILLGNLVFWIVFFVLFNAVAKVNGWTTIASKFEAYTQFIPLVIGGVFIVAIGLYLSRFLSNVTKAILTKAEPRSANVLSNVVYYVLMIIIVTTALSFAGISTTIITANLSIILGAILLAFSISFVFGAKGILKDILSSSYNKHNYKPGQKVIVDDFEGEIVKISNTSVILKSANKVRVIPASRFTEDVVDIIG